MEKKTTRPAEARRGLSGTEVPGDLKDRNLVILRTSLGGIAANIVLSAFKVLVGLITHSIAITLDAVNNLTDAVSLLITIAGTALAARRPDREHPWGHGRIEYLSSMLLGFLVLFAGVSSLVESIRKILQPRTPSYSVLPLVIVGVCVLVKVFLWRYVSSKGERVHSETLISSGKDALMDALVSASTLAAALVYVFTGVALEAYLGVGISLLILKTGVDMQRQTVSEILGERVSPEIVRKVRRTVESFPEVHGVYDVMLHDFGPDRIAGSLHVEVDDMLRAYEVSDLLRRIGMEVLEKHGVNLTAISIYAKNTHNEEAVKLRDEIKRIALSHEHVLQVHGVYLRDGDVKFDMIIDFDAKDPEMLCRHVEEDIHRQHPELTVEAYWDPDYSVSE